jgi:hypothetical protein
MEKISEINVIKNNQRSILPIFPDEKIAVVISANACDETERPKRAAGASKSYSD